MMKHSDWWHKSLYDGLFIQHTIGSPAFIKKAFIEADFVAKVAKLKKRMSVLDVPCGIGRHSLALAKLSMLVTGVDINSECIRLAKMKSKHPMVQYHLGNIGKLGSYKNRYDCLINLFSSFGYFPTDAKNLAVMKGMVLTLKPGGRFVLSTINRDWLLKHYGSVRWDQNGSLFRLQAGHYDPKTKYNEAQIVYIDKKTGQGQNYYHRLRLYNKEEMLALMKKAGLKKIRIYGDYKGTRYSRFSSTHPIYVGEKK